MASEVQEQVVREAPDIEAAKVGLMGSAKSLVDSTNQSALSGQYLTPDYQVAGMSPDQLAALQLGRQGIGAYQPYMSAAGTGVAVGGNTLGEAAGVLRGADTRGQFAAAQTALNEAGAPIDRMGQYVQNAGQGIGLIGQGAGQLQGAQQASQQGIGSLAGVTGMYDPSMAQGFMNPYMQSVINESMRQINRQGDIARQNLQGQAVRSGAFGGSREGAQRAELERALSEQRNAAITGTLSQGYQQALGQSMQAFEQDKARQLAQAQGYQQAAGTQGQLGSTLAGLSGMYGNIAGQQAGILGQQSQLGQALGQGIGSLAGQQFNIGSTMAQGLGALGTQQANIGMQNAALGQQAQGLAQGDTNFLYNLGTAQQKQLQGELDADRQNTLNQNMQPYQQLGFLSDIYKGAPSSQMSSMQQTQAAPSPFQQAAGLGISAVTAGAVAKKAELI